MGEDDDMAIQFYKIGDAADLAEKVVAILESPELQREMSLHNYEAGVQMTMTNVARSYLRWFELHKLKREVRGDGFKERMRYGLWNLWYGRDTLVPRLKTRKGQQVGGALHKSVAIGAEATGAIAKLPPMPVNRNTSGKADGYRGQTL